MELLPFLANWAIATIHTGHRVVCYGVGCESTCRGGQCYRRLTPWLIPNGPDSQNRCPEGRIIKDSPHVVPDHDDGGGPLNLLIVSLYNPPPSQWVSSPLLGPYSQQRRLLFAPINQVPLSLSRKTAPSAPICHASTSLRNRRTLPSFKTQNSKSFPSTVLLLVIDLPLFFFRVFKELAENNLLQIFEKPAFWREESRRQE